LPNWAPAFAGVIAELMPNRLYDSDPDTEKW